MVSFISQLNMSTFGLKFWQMILHTETSQLYVHPIDPFCVKRFAQANTLTQYL